MYCIFRLDQVGNVVSGLLNHLVIISSALQYLHRRVDISNSPPDAASTSLREMVTALVHLHAAQATLRRTLHTLLTELSKVFSIIMSGESYSMDVMLHLEGI